MQVLVTGGAGFIGSNLIKKLKENWKDCDIISLDNYSSGYKRNHVKNVRYIYDNTWNILEIEELKNFNPIYVFHFGEYSRIVQSLDEPSITFRSNTIGTQQVLEYCIKKNSKLIYSGSSAIFGNNMKDQNLNPYSWTKSKNIELIHNYKNWYNLDFAICYFYNVYGDGQITEGKYATVIGVFEEQFKKGEELTVVTPGTQKRIFTHIDDVIQGIINVALNGYGDKYYLYSNDEYSIIDVAKIFSNNIIMINPRKGERTSSIKQKSRAIHELNWKPMIKLIDYINNKKDKENI
jgi:UDP-glucose 4-epimerase